MAKKAAKKKKVAPDFQSRNRDEMQRKHSKTILFNDKEISVIDQYCKKFSVRNKSAFFREIIITHILQQIDDNYPKLF